MMKLAFALSTALLAGSACRDSTDTPQPEYPAAKTVESPPPPSDDEFVRTRDEAKARMKERLARIEVRLRELGDRTDAESREAVARLRVKRDQLEARIQQAGNYAKNNWKQFEAEVSASFQELEADLDRRF